MERQCEECGSTFTAKTRRARFCGATCRVRANRRPTKTGKAKAAAADVVGIDAPAGPRADGQLATQVRETLTELEALTTVAGMSALMVARQIDRGEDSGSAVATLSKELSRLMAEAKVEAAPRIRDGADDVMQRAAEKLLRLVQ